MASSHFPPGLVPFKSTMSINSKSLRLKDFNSSQIFRKWHTFINVTMDYRSVCMSKLTPFS